jgi:hypothetical protein
VIGEPRMREDMVRVGMGTADIRYRPEFPVWRIPRDQVQRVVISAEQIANLINTAGFASASANGGRRRTAVRPLPRRRRGRVDEHGLSVEGRRPTSKSTPSSRAKSWSESAPTRTAGSKNRRNI